MQQGMLFHGMYDPQSGVYVEQLICGLHERLDIPAFKKAWRRVIERHTVLRTSFHWEGCAEPRQETHRYVSLPWEYRDWRGIAAVERRWDVYVEDDQRLGFEFTKAPLTRLALFRIAENDYRFMWTFHHALLDGRSVLIVLKELFAYYEAFRRGQDLHFSQPRPYRDYIHWLGNQDLGKAERFWRNILRGFTAGTHLAVDHTRAVRPDEKSYGTRETRLSRATTSRLQSLAQEHQLTPNTILLGAWAVLLNRYSGEEDVVFGATRACRRSAFEGTESMVGLFINTLPVRARLSPESRLLPWLKELRSQWVAIRDYEHTPLGKVKEWSEIPAEKPLFESILVFENCLLNSVLQAQDGIGKQREFRLRGPTNYPLTVAGYLDQELVLEIGYDRRLFDDAAIGRMLGHLEMLLEGIVADPWRRLTELPLLTDRERLQLLVEWNDTGTDYPRDECIHQLFEAQAERTPDAVAVVFEGSQLTYRELNRRANQLARHLQKLGVGPEMLVGICTERSLEMVVGLLGILKAGGAYLPLDPSYPRERLAFMLNETRAPVLLTQQRLLDSLAGPDTRIICLDSDWETISRENSENTASGVKADNLAYVIYTSGSTGTPKGVMVCHRGVCNFLHWRCEYFPLGEADRLLQKASFCFDDSVWEFFEPLMVGARLIMALPGGHRDSAYLVRLISEQKITAVSFVPSMLHIFLEEKGVDNCKSLRRVTTGGEVLPVELQERFFSRLGADLHNGYGPTEATISSTFWTCRRGGDQRIVPIGRPIANTQVYLLDGLLRPVPIGVQGELYIGGVGLARGYFNRPELTADRFIPNPFSTEPCARLYRTGDLARYRPDGNLEFIGRVDHQVKIHGFRIEPGEIEFVLSRHPAVEKAAVLARNTVSEENRLVAYVVFALDRNASAAELQDFLREKLPAYMIPSAFVFLENFPINPNGKLDRNALPVPNQTDPNAGRDFTEPRDKFERKLAEIWEEALGVKPIGITDSFFDLGGDSLLLPLVLGRIEKTFGLRLPLATLYQAPSIERLARLLRKEDRQPHSLQSPVRAGSKPPFFMFHGFASFPFLERSLDADQPLYYLSNYWDKMELPRHSRIEDMAVKYLREIRKVQPESPYFLGGYSVGGVLALEVAQLLLRQGNEVALLFLVAPSTPCSSSLSPNNSIGMGTVFSFHQSSAIGRCRALFKDLAEPHEKPSNMMERSGCLIKRFRKAAGWLSKWLTCKACHRFGLTMPARLRKFVSEEIDNAYSRALKAYIPKPFSGRMVLLMDETPTPENISCWKNLAVGELEIHRISAHHQDIVKEPHVHLWIEQLRLCLKKAHAAPDSDEEDCLAE